MMKFLPIPAEKSIKKRFDPTSVTKRTKLFPTRRLQHPYLQEISNMFRFSTLAVAFSLGLLLAASCSGSRQESVQTTFTSADSLTDRLLQLQDSMLYAWNVMVKDDTRKFRSIHDLLHRMMTMGYHDQEALIALEHRLSGVSNFALTQESIDDPTLVEEYDFATASLVTELTSLAQSHESFADDPYLREKVQEIILIDQQVESNRRRYDAIAQEYNRFLKKHRDAVMDLELGIPLTEKPLFEIASGE
jgi:hypothetical protein|nr:MAG: hypothetical protein DIU61_08360 [Bacteroidota bacterium]